LDLRGIAQGEKAHFVEAQYLYEFKRQGGFLLDAGGEDQIGKCLGCYR